MTETADARLDRTRQREREDQLRWEQFLRAWDLSQDPEELRVARTIHEAMRPRGGPEHERPHLWDNMHWVRRQPFINAARAVIRDRIGVGP